MRGRGSRVAIVRPRYDDMFDIDVLGRKRYARSTRGDCGRRRCAGSGAPGREHPEARIEVATCRAVTGLVLILAAATATSIVLWPRSPEPVAASAPTATPAATSDTESPVREGTPAPVAAADMSPQDLAERYGDSVWKVESEGCGFLSTGGRRSRRRLVGLGKRQRPGEGQDVVALGYPVPDHSFTVIPATIMSFQTDGDTRQALRLDGLVDKGNSGGPALTSTGEGGRSGHLSVG